MLKHILIITLYVLHPFSEIELLIYQVAYHLITFLSLTTLRGDEKQFTETSNFETRHFTSQSKRLISPGRFYCFWLRDAKTIPINRSIGDEYSRLDPGVRLEAMLTTRHFVNAFSNAHLERKAILLPHSCINQISVT